MNPVKNSRPHLTKDQRLPQYLKETEKVIRKVKSCKSNIKTVLANSRLRNCIAKKVYNLSINVLKHYNYIQKIINNIDLLEKEKYLRREIASILVYEMIFGIKYLLGESKIITTLRKYENDIMMAHQELQKSNTSSFLIKEISIPRYVRVHTLVTTVSYVIKDLESLGFKQINYDDLSEEKYLELVKNLEQGYFLIDFHFKDILVFECRENLTDLDLYKNGHIVLQDKASYIPVHALNPKPGDAILDACAAPGMKTIHIASKMKNKGILIACERDKVRVETLKEMIQYGAVKICKVLCKDFKQLNPNDQAYSAIEHILLDPSCSGSGMISRMDEVTDTEDSKNEERLIKLAGFQIILLKHALRFPSVKKVVYSTCSVNEQENEYVVQEALNSCSGVFKLVPVMPEWSVRGSENFEFGTLCLRTVPEKHLTNGFFVAMFERVDPNGCKEEIYISKNQKHKIIANISENEDESVLDFNKVKKGENSFDCQKKYEFHDPQLCHNKQDDSSALPFKKHKKGTVNRLDMLNQLPEHGENLNQFMKEGYMIKQIKYDCDSKKLKKKKENVIDFNSKNINESTNNDHEKYVFNLHKAKKHKSCEQLPCGDSSSLCKQFKIKDKASAFDVLSEFSEGGAISNQFTEDKHVAKQINFDDSKKSKKLKKKKERENVIDFQLEFNKKSTNSNYEKMSKKHKVCEQSPCQLIQSDNSSLFCKKLEKDSVRALTIGDQVLEDGESSIQFIEEKHVRKRNDINNESCKTMKLKKKKREKEVHFNFTATEELPEKLMNMDLDSQTLNRTADIAFDVPETKEKHKRKRHLNLEMTNVDNSDALLNKKKEKHSKHSDFHSNEFLTLSKSDTSSKRRKNKKHKYSSLLDEKNHLSPTIELAKITNETPQYSEGTFMCSSIESGDFSGKKSKKHKKAGRIKYDNKSFTSIGGNNTIINEKPVDFDDGTIVSNDLETSFVCSSFQKNHTKSEKSKKCKNKHKKSKRENKSEESTVLNFEEITSIENDPTVKKIKKYKNKEHGNEKMDDLKKKFKNYC